METIRSLIVLGASDPEMGMIEKVAAQAYREGEEQYEEGKRHVRREFRVAYAVGEGGRRVRPDTAYDAVGYSIPGSEPVYTAWSGGDVVWIECAGDLPKADLVIDHHRPGDPGYGRNPSGFLGASSIGQFVAYLARRSMLPWPRKPLEWFDWINSEYDGIGSFIGRDDDGWYVVTSVYQRTAAFVPVEVVWCAAADHCLAAAYRGECRGVDPQDLMEWRAESRAAFQKRSAAEVLSDVKAARDALSTAPVVLLPAMDGWPSDIPVRDMRRSTPVTELPEAACRYGFEYISGPLVGPDGRSKFTCSGSAQTIRTWMSWAAKEGLTGVYGDPARGFAGAYDVAHTAHLGEQTPAAH